MVGALRASAPRSIAGLYALTPDHSDTGEMIECVAAALEGGATAVQYRNKTAAPKLRLQQARALQSLCVGRGATFIINDDIDLVRGFEIVEGIFQGDIVEVHFRPLRQLSLNSLFSGTFAAQIDVFPLLASFRQSGPDFRGREANRWFVREGNVC